MSLDEGRESPGPGTDQRATFLTVLGMVIGERHGELRSHLVTRGRTCVLVVAGAQDGRPGWEVGCEFDRAEGWSFTWVGDGAVIGPVQDAPEVAATIARTLKARE